MWGVFALCRVPVLPLRYGGNAPERNTVDWNKAINWDKVDEILANPDKPENAQVIEILNKMKDERPDN